MTSPPWNMKKMAEELHIGSWQDSALDQCQPRGENNRKKSERDSFKLRPRVQLGVLSGYTDVDQSANPQSFVQHLDRANTYPDLQKAKERLRDLLNPKKDDHILDVGCGLGLDSYALAEIVGKTGLVVGLDSSATMIREARRRAELSEASLEFHVGDAHALDFPDGSFDSCFVASTLMHVKDPAKVLTELARVLKPGGRLVALECDWETLVISAENRSLERKVMALLRGAIRNPGIGHQLPVLFHALRLHEIGVGAGTLTVFDYVVADQLWRIQENMTQAVRAGALTGKAARNLTKELRAVSYAGRFFAATTSFAVSGTKPRTL